MPDPHRDALPTDRRAPDRRDGNLPPPSPGNRGPSEGAGGLIRQHPHAIFAGVTVAVAAITGGLLSSALQVGFFACLAWMLGPAALALMGYDKVAAGREWPRVPERVLLGLAVLGAAFFVVLGQQLFRHKTVKPGFVRLLNLIVTAHLLLAWLALGLWLR